VVPQQKPAQKTGNCVYVYRMLMQCRWACVWYFL